MRRAICILAIATLISLALDVMVVPNATVANMAVTKSRFHNEVSVYGLHIALPEGMKNFPVELIPLP